MTVDILIDNIDIDPKNILDTYWKEGIGAGQANLLLRRSVQNHLKDCVDNCEFKYVRFHGLFSDDMLSYRESKQGYPIYNWQYSDGVLDYIIDIKTKPFVSFTFMPSALAEREDCYIGWPKFNASPPKDYNKWADMVENFVKHCIKRYGMDEVSGWYFEAWNEPDLMFGDPWDAGYWAGKIEDFFKLYEVMARRLKEINPEFNVGGPSTSCFNDYDEPGKMKPPYLKEFLEYCYKNNVPIDHISNHPYPTNFPNDQIGLESFSIEHKWREDDALKNDASYIKKLVENSPFPSLEIHLNEWSISPGNEDTIHDDLCMAPFIIKNILECQNLVNSLAFFMFTDIFEESIKGDSIFSGGFGLVNTQGIRKPAFHAYKFLNMLGDNIIEQGKDFIITKKANGSVQILLWDYRGLEDLDNNKTEKIKEFKLIIRNAKRFKTMLHYGIDSKNGSAKEAWERLGSPNPPDRKEICILKKLAEPFLNAEIIKDDNFSKKIILPKHGVSFIELLKND